MALKGEFILKKPEGILKEPSRILKKEPEGILNRPQAVAREELGPAVPPLELEISPIKPIPRRHVKPRFFSSYVEHPDGVKFEMQEDNEEIIIFVRRDLITNIPWVATAIFLAFLPIFLVPLLPNLLSLIAISPSFQIFVILFYYLALFGYILLNFSLWYFHVSLITNERILDIDIHGIVLREVAEARISQIQDVSYVQNGFLRSLFDYGDVIIQTAGTEANIEFDKTPKPARIVQILSELIEKAKGGEIKNDTS